MTGTPGLRTCGKYLWTPLMAAMEVRVRGMSLRTKEDGKKCNFPANLLPPAAIFLSPVLRILCSFSVVRLEPKSPTHYFSSILCPGRGHGSGQLIVLFFRSSESNVQSLWKFIGTKNCSRYLQYCILVSDCKSQAIFFKMLSKRVPFEIAVLASLGASPKLTLDT